LPGGCLTPVSSGGSPGSPAPARAATYSRAALWRDSISPAPPLPPTGTYKIPTANDIPIDFRVSLLRGSPCARTPLVRSSKAVGEPPFFLGASAFFALKEACYAARSDAGALAAWVGLPAVTGLLLPACYCLMLLPEAAAYCCCCEKEWGRAAAGCTRGAGAGLGWGEGAACASSSGPMCVRVGVGGWFQLDSPAAPERLRLACADEVAAPFVPRGLRPKLSC
jgi:hypothetical protein